jgi:hypothetical protein
MLFKIEHRYERGQVLISGSWNTVHRGDPSAVTDFHREALDIDLTPVAKISYG